jgi:hypothetical protein
MRTIPQHEMLGSAAAHPSYTRKQLNTGLC